MGPMAATPCSMLITKHTAFVNSPPSAFSSEKPEFRQYCALPSISSRGLLYTGRLQIPAASSRRPFAIKALSSDGGRSSNAAGIFVGGFVLGGIIVGALSCVYAQKISSVLAGADRKDVLKKLPKFIYDEEKATENTKQVLAKKIEELNSSIDAIYAKRSPEDAPSVVPTQFDEIVAVK